MTTSSRNECYVDVARVVKDSSIMSIMSNEGVCKWRLTHRVILFSSFIDIQLFFSFSVDVKNHGREKKSEISPLFFFLLSRNKNERKSRV